MCVCVCERERERERCCNRLFGSTSSNFPDRFLATFGTTFFDFFLDFKIKIGEVSKKNHFGDFFQAALRRISMPSGGSGSGHRDLWFRMTDLCG